MAKTSMVWGENNRVHYTLFPLLSGTSEFLCFGGRRLGRRSGRRNSRLCAVCLLGSAQSGQAATHTLGFELGRQLVTFSASEETRCTVVTAYHGRKGLGPRGPCAAGTDGANCLRRALAPQGGQGEAVLVQPGLCRRQALPQGLGPLTPRNPVFTAVSASGAVVTKPCVLGAESNVGLSQSGGRKSGIQVWTGRAPYSIWGMIPPTSSTPGVLGVTLSSCLVRPPALCVHLGCLLLFL